MLYFTDIVLVFVYVCRLSEGQRQSNGPMARYNCVGSERSLDNCSFNVDESACKLPASSIVACSKSYCSYVVSSSYVIYCYFML